MFLFYPCVVMFEVGTRGKNTVTNTFMEDVKNTLMRDVEGTSKTDVFYYVESTHVF